MCIPIPELKYLFISEIHEFVSEITMNRSTLYLIFCGWVQIFQKEKVGVPVNEGRCSGDPGGGGSILQLQKPAR